MSVVGGVVSNFPLGFLPSNSSPGHREWTGDVCRGYVSWWLWCGVRSLYQWCPCTSSWLRLNSDSMWDGPCSGCPLDPAGEWLIWAEGGYHCNDVGCEWYWSWQGFGFGLSMPLQSNSYGIRPRKVPDIVNQTKLISFSELKDEGWCCSVWSSSCSRLGQP